jgi:hypothetical protein
MIGADTGDRHIEANLTKLVVVPPAGVTGGAFRRNGFGIGR